MINLELVIDIRESLAARKIGGTGYQLSSEENDLVYEILNDYIMRNDQDFVLVPKESLKVALFWMNEDIDPWQMGGDSFAELYEHKPILEKAMIEAQEQSHEH